jgi:riboflavin synthase
MFTGIVERIGTIAERREIPGGADLTVAASGFAGDLALGESVCVSGVCLTVTARNADTFRTQAIRETLERTNLGLLVPGDAVNLERSVRPTDRMGGHIVTGHVDATARILDVRDNGAEWLVRVELPPSLATHFVEKGSVAVKGVSLTVAEVNDSNFVVYLIPFTREATNLGAIARGTLVNIESDLIGKYAARVLAQHAAAQRDSGAAGVAGAEGTKGSREARADLVFPEGSLR